MDLSAMKVGMNVDIQRSDGKYNFLFIPTHGDSYEVAEFITFTSRFTCLFFVNIAEIPKDNTLILTYLIKELIIEWTNLNCRAKIVVGMGMKS